MSCSTPPPCEGYVHREAVMLWTLRKGSGNGAVAMTWNWYPFSTLKTSFNTAPAIADINNDGLPDLVLGHGCQLDLQLRCTDCLKCKVM